jgi:hypothetical protein
MKLKGGTRLKYEKNKEADEKKTGHDPVNLNPATHFIKKKHIPDTIDAAGQFEIRVNS